MAVSILEVRIDVGDLSQMNQKAAVFLADHNQHMICTPNPEMLVAAHKDTYLKEILNKADLNLCDGKGVELAGRGKLTRVAGVDFMRSLCGLASKEGKSVFFLGSGSQKTIDRLLTRIKKDFPDVRVAGFHPGYQLRQLLQGRLDYDKDKDDAVMQDIIMAAPDILFVAFGHGKQEKWLYEHLPELPSVKIGMGVGGAFDFLAGQVSRAPIWMRTAGLEWLWRLGGEPWRWKRIGTAVFVFPYLCLTQRKRRT